MPGSKIQNYLHHWDQGFSGLVIILVVPVVVLLGALFYFYRPTILTNYQVANSTNQPTPTATPNPWKTYTNNEYGFEITYPATGVILSEEGMQEGECGNAIKLDTNKSTTNTILVDNFFGVKVVEWDKTIADYMKI